MEKGVALLLNESQVSGPDALNEYLRFKVDIKWQPISGKEKLFASSAKSRVLLSELGSEGEIVHTPGHSTDSDSLVIDGECAYT